MRDFFPGSMVWFTQSKIGGDPGRRNRRCKLGHWEGEFPQLIYGALIKVCTFRLKQGPDGRFSNGRKKLVIF